MGSALALPSELHQSQVHGLPSFSPDGAYIALPLLGGDIAIVERATNTLRRIGADMVREPARSYSTQMWLDGSRLAVSERWMDAEQRAAIDADPPVVNLHKANRVIDVSSGQTVHYAEGEGQDGQY
jgi:hypothetical protein